MGKLGIIIFDVEHGFCAFVRSPNGYGILIDCGRKGSFSPVKYILEKEASSLVELNGFSLAQFILTHPHDDHLNDIKRLKNCLPPATMVSQRYDWEEVKNGSRQQGEYENLDAFSQWRESYNQEVQLPDWGTMKLDNYFLTPLEAKELDETSFVNNSSIVTVVEYNGFKAVFPGDLEEAGWRALLKRQDFASSIRDAALFVASHHGHSSGYCREIFETMDGPLLNVVSARKKDSSVAPAYSSSCNARGIIWNRSGFIHPSGLRNDTRRMLSTRDDGTISIEVDENGDMTVECDHIKDNL